MTGNAVDCWSGHTHTRTPGGLDHCYSPLQLPANVCDTVGAEFRVGGTNPAYELFCPLPETRRPWRDGHAKSGLSQYSSNLPASGTTAHALLGSFLQHDYTHPTSHPPFSRPNCPSDRSRRVSHTPTRCRTLTRGPSLPCSCSCCPGPCPPYSCPAAGPLARRPHPRQTRHPAPLPGEQHKYQFDGGHVHTSDDNRCRLFWAVLATGFAIATSSLLRNLVRMWREGGGGLS